MTQAIPLALQHVVAMIVGCVTPAIIVAGVTNAGSQEQILLIQAALVISGIATLIQICPIGGFCGSGLPVIMGASFAYIPMLLSLGARFDLATIFGAQLVGGFVAILVGIFYKKIQTLFPPIVTGTVVFTIGLSLYPTAVNYMAGGVGGEGMMFSRTAVNNSLLFKLIPKQEGKKTPIEQLEKRLNLLSH